MTVPAAIIRTRVALLELKAALDNADRALEKANDAGNGQDFDTLLAYFSGEKLWNLERALEAFDPAVA